MKLKITINSSVHSFFGIMSEIKFSFIENSDEHAIGIITVYKNTDVYFKLLIPKNTTIDPCTTPKGVRYNGKYLSISSEFIRSKIPSHELELKIIPRWKAF